MTKKRSKEARALADKRYAQRIVPDKKREAKGVCPTCCGSGWATREDPTGTMPYTETCECKQ